MREKPNLPDSRIIAHLGAAYGLKITRVEFLPLGADINSAVYRVEAADGTPYFLKLRKGKFEQNSVLTPRFLYEQGIRQVIPPLLTVHHQPWSRLGSAATILYPFIEGQNGFDVTLTGEQWIEFGQALKALHSTALPPELAAMIRVESFSAYFRETVRAYQARVATQAFDDPTASRMAEFMRQHAAEIRMVVERAEALAQEVQAQNLPPVLCHSDIHGGNLLITPGGALYMVDWDDLIIAPKERDLMFIGGGIGMGLKTVRQQALFYEGYGPAAVSRSALAYYRYDRIVQDMAAYSEQILDLVGGEEDRQEGLGYFASNFLPGGEIEIAMRTEQNI